VTWKNPHFHKYIAANSSDAGCAPLYGTKIKFILYHKRYESRAQKVQKTQKPAHKKYKTNT
jgi:hypothetical protein